MKLSPELQKYYDECLSTLATPGWALIVADLTRWRDANADIRNHATPEAFTKARGVVEALDHAIHLRDIYTRGLESVETQPEPTPEAADEAGE